MRQHTAARKRCGELAKAGNADAREAMKFL